MAEEENQDLEVLSPTQYQNRLVDFYRQTLGSTGIQTTKPEEDDDKKEDYVAPQVIPDQDSDDGMSGLPVLNISGKDSVLDFTDTTRSVLEMNLPETYQEHLERNNREDKADLGKFEKSINNQFSKLEDIFNKNAKTKYGIGIDLPNAKQAQRYAGTQVLGAMLGIQNPLVMMTVGSLVSGKTETNIQGTDGQFKPGGMLGIIQDINKSFELGAYNANKVAYREVQDAYNRGLGVEMGDFDNYLRGQDIGFSMSTGGNENLGVYRKAGDRIYNGAMYGISQEQAARVEAISKGKVITGFNPLNPSESENLSTFTPGKGGYAQNGTYNDVRFGVSAVGRKSDAEREAKKNGLTYNQFMSAVNKARTNKGGLSQYIKEEQRKITPTQIISSGDDNQDNIRDDQIDEQTYTTETATLSTTPPTSGGFFTDDDDGFTGGDSDSVSSVSDAADDPADGFDFNKGGRVGMQNGGNTTEVVQPAGFIAPDPNATDQQEIADDKPMDAKKGDFIINAPAAEEAGKQDIQRMIDTAITNLQEKGVDVRFGNPKMNIRDKVKLLVSRNEVYIPAVIAKEIGYDRLKKINNRGKREVQRRQEEAEQAPQQGMNNGGFIQKKKGDVVQQGGFIPTPVTKDMATFTVFKNFLKQKKPLRRDIEKFIDTIPEDKGRLAILAGVETPLESSTLPELEAVIQTILNRVNDRTFEYRNINTVQDIMKQRSRRGTGSRMFMYDGLERTNLQNRLKEIINNPKVFEAGLNAAENVLTKGGGEPDYETEMLPPDVFQYSVEGKASESNERNPKLKFYKQIGKHRFYQRVR